MNSKSRVFSSFLIALVAALGYYMLTDFSIKDIQIKTFSSLGIPFRMYQINNSVKQKKLTLPKVVYTYATVQQDQLKTPQIDLIVSDESDADEFLAGFMDASTDATNKKQARITDITRYGMKEITPENSPRNIPQPPGIPLPLNTDCGTTITVPVNITQEDIEMVVTTVATQNVKKIEECFKKIKIIYGEDRSIRNSVIISGTTKQSKQTRGSVVNSCSTVTETRNMKKATPVADEDYEEETSEEDTDY